ncbi:MAG: prepilin-type N-terminal cleavage/methylation domain-containing protein [Bacilli bacterium]|nr:prepilin-type N-terminal cleavage/methylation domain-containing protein [Bacilli bacterium]
MDKKGLSLVELIGALVILSILVSLSAMIINFFIQANQRITISSQANYEGNLVIRRIEEDLIELSPTTYNSCPGTCFSIEREFSYELNEVSDIVELVVYAEPVTYEIEINKGILYINGSVYDFGEFTLHSDSSLMLSQTAGINDLELIIVLESSRGDLYQFLLSYSFEEKVIPNG